MHQPPRKTPSQHPALYGHLSGLFKPPLIPLRHMLRDFLHRIHRLGHAILLRYRHYFACYCLPFIFHLKQRSLSAGSRHTPFQCRHAGLQFGCFPSAPTNYRITDAVAQWLGHSIGRPSNCSFEVRLHRNQYRTQAASLPQKRPRASTRIHAQTSLQQHL